MHNIVKLQAQILLFGFVNVIPNCANLHGLHGHIIVCFCAHRFIKKIGEMLRGLTFLGCVYFYLEKKQ